MIDVPDVPFPAAIASGFGVTCLVAAAVLLTYALHGWPRDRVRLQPAVNGWQWTYANDVGAFVVSRIQPHDWEVEFDLTDPHLPYRSVTFHHGNATREDAVATIRRLTAETRARRP